MEVLNLWIKIIIKKPQTTRNNIKPKTLLGSKQNLNSSNNKTKKVKFNNKVEVIDVECWKIYNAEQTADENFDAFFTDFEKEDKEKINKEEKKNNNNNNKRNTKKDTISCTCTIIWNILIIFFYYKYLLKYQ